MTSRHHGLAYGTRHATILLVGLSSMKYFQTTDIFSYLWKGFTGKESYVDETEIEFLH